MKIVTVEYRRLRTYGEYQNETVGAVAVSLSLVLGTLLAFWYRSSRSRFREVLSFIAQAGATLVMRPIPLALVFLSMSVTTAAAESVVLRSRTGSATEDAELVHRAWDLGALADAYHAFGREHRNHRPTTPEARFRATVELVHDWRRFPSIDPELPTALLPPRWAGATAAATFHECRDRWRAGALEWFAAQEATHPL